MLVSVCARQGKSTCLLKHPAGMSKGKHASGFIAVMSMTWACTIQQHSDSQTLLRQTVKCSVYCVQTAGRRGGISLSARRDGRGDNES